MLAEGRFDEINRQLHAVFEQRFATALNLGLLSHAWRDTVCLWIE